MTVWLAGNPGRWVYGCPAFLFDRLRFPGKQLIRSEIHPAGHKSIQLDFQEPNELTIS